MAKTYFTNLTEVKKNTLLDTNIDDKILLVMLNEAHNRYLQQQLGTNTYKDLLSKIGAGTINIIERTLIEDYIKDYLYNVVDLISTISLITKFSNNGVLRDTPTYSATAALDELKTIRISHSANVGFTGGLIKDYILENLTSFPLYQDAEAYLKPKQQNTFGFVVYDEDFIEDQQHKLRRAGNSYEEGI